MGIWTGVLELSFSLDSKSWYTHHQLISFSAQVGPFYLTSIKVTGTTRYSPEKLESDLKLLVLNNEDND